MVDEITQSVGGDSDEGNPFNRYSTEEMNQILNDWRKAAWHSQSDQSTIDNLILNINRLIEKIPLFGEVVSIFREANEINSELDIDELIQSSKNIIALTKIGDLAGHRRGSAVRIVFSVRLHQLISLDGTKIMVPSVHLVGPGMGMSQAIAWRLATDELMGIGNAHWRPDKTETIKTESGVELKHERSLLISVSPTETPMQVYYTSDSAAEMLAGRVKLAMVETETLLGNLDTSLPAHAMREWLNGWNEFRLSIEGEAHQQWFSHSVDQIDENLRTVARLERQVTKSKGAGVLSDLFGIAETVTGMIGDYHNYVARRNADLAQKKWREELDVQTRALTSSLDDLSSRMDKIQEEMQRIPEITKKKLEEKMIAPLYEQIDQMRSSYGQSINRPLP